MNAAREAKQELTKTPDNGCCKAAFLSAVFHTAGIISIVRGGMRVIVESVNPLLENVIREITDGLFAGGKNAATDKKTDKKADKKTDKNVDKKTGKKADGAADLKQEKITVSGDFVPDMLLQLRILKLRDGFKLVEGIDPFLIEDDCCKRAYLKGAFVGGGALITAKGYHLEFACASKRLRDDIIRLLEDFEIRAAALSRGGKHLAYIKNSEMVSDCLAFMGAAKSVLALNSLMAQRSLSQDVSRMANCDLANLNRLVTASVRQREAISKLGFIKDAKLAATAEARMTHPEVSYEDLAAILGISKGAVKYRLEQLVKMAAEK